MMTMYEMSAEERTALGAKACTWANENFGFDKYAERWDALFQKIHEERGSWESRSQYTSYEMRTF